MADWPVNTALRCLLTGGRHAPYVAAARPAVRRRQQLRADGVHRGGHLRRDAARRHRRSPAADRAADRAHADPSSRRCRASRWPPVSSERFISAGPASVVATGIARTSRRKRFVPDRFGQAPGARLYRTGDLGRLLPDGQIAFHGRDGQSGQDSWSPRRTGRDRERPCAAPRSRGGRRHGGPVRERRDAAGRLCRAHSVRVIGAAKRCASS